jgi:acyl carrier protein
MNTTDRLTDVFRQVFEDKTIVLTPETTANDIDGWDSLSHVNLIVAVEAAFNIEFTRQEATRFKNVGELIANIEKKTGTL